MRQRPLCAFVVCLAAPAGLGAERYVRAGATGSGTGADWTNAYPALPAALVRGDTYFVAAGTYPTYTFDDPTSGTLSVTIKKATSTAHGTNSGWEAAFGAGPAIFAEQLNFLTSHWVVDGQTGGGPPNWTGGFGIKVQATATIAGLRIGPVSDITLRHVEVQGTLDNSQGGSYGQDGIAVYGGTNVTLSHFHIHDMGRTIFFLAAQDFVAENGVTGRHVSTASVHSELASVWDFAIPVRRITFRFNVFTHAEGTGGIIIEGDDVRIYGNVFYRPPGDAWAFGNGLVGSWTVSTATNVKVYNNTFIVSGNEGPVFGGLFTPPTTGNEARNNLFYTVTDVGLGAGRLFPSSSHNHYVDTPSGSETGKSTASGNPFVDFANYDFRLVGATPPATNLPAEFAVDLYGVARGADGVWDRGAIEFRTGGQPPSPLGQLRVTP